VENVGSPVDRSDDDGRPYSRIITSNIKTTSVIVAPQLLSASAELARAIQQVSDLGATWVQALSPAGCETLRREVDGSRFRAQPETIGPVRQRLETLELRDQLSSFPGISRLRDELVAAVDRYAAPESPLRRWRPNDVSVQRYRPSADIGITPHLDGRRHALLVAVVTIEGRARFALHPDRYAEPTRSWPVVPGTLVLLRGPGLAGPDERPFHSVSAPLGGSPRYSIGFRMDTRPPAGD
jgi:alkylated DNA repair dioxygenase AlkB